MTSSDPRPTAPATALPSPLPSAVPPSSVACCSPEMAHRQVSWTLLKPFPLPVCPAFFCSGHSSLAFKFPCSLPCSPRPAPLPQKPCADKKTKQSNNNSENLAINKVWGCWYGTKVWAYSCGAWPRGALEKSGVSWLSFCGGWKSGCRRPSVYQPSQCSHGWRMFRSKETISASPFFI